MAVISFLVQAPAVSLIKLFFAVNISTLCRLDHFSLPVKLAYNYEILRFAKRVIQFIPNLFLYNQLLELIA